MTTEQSNEIPKFEPHPLLKNRHLQTIVGRYLPGPEPRGHARIHQVKCEDGDVLTLLENKAGRKSVFRKIIVLMHGLAGDAQSPYMLRMAAHYLNRGWTVFRMNHRGCGAGAGLARKTYHSGKSDDVAGILNEIARLYPDTPQVAVGFSMSGNALLKLLGETIEVIPKNLQGAIAVTPPVDLGLCSDALARPGNRIYDRRFTLQLQASMKEKKRMFTDFPEFNFPQKMTVRRFDELCTAPIHGFESADDYYQKCSAKQFLADISLPTVVIASKDDPFVPVKSFADLPVNENIHYHFTGYGGHMGFISASPTPLGSRRWLDYAVLRYSERLMSGMKVE